MIDAMSATERDDLLARFAAGLSTRTLRHVAEEARLDGESLKEAVERYEIDYAWHVLGSPRMLDACNAALGATLGEPLSDLQRGLVREVLQSTAAAQPSDALMSFDNDVPGHLSQLLESQLADRSVVESA